MTEGLKKGWTKVAFGDVVRLVKERSSNPAADGFDRSVGLEHLDPGELKIRRWGDIADGITFTSVFQAGQVLFGKRRAYQRKLAVADFDGVCSGDIYVFEPKNRQLLPEFLPFICQTDNFFEYAIGTSAGSLSPRTNWKSMAEYEFALPPMEEQRKYSSILHSIMGLVESYEIINNSFKTLEKAWLSDKTESLLKTAPKHKLVDVCKSINDGTHVTPKYVNDGVPFLRVTDIQNRVIDWSKTKRISNQEHKVLIERCNPQKGDLLLSKNGTIGLTKVIDWDTPFSIFVSLCLIKPSEIISSHYISLLFKSPYIEKQLMARIKQGTVKNLHLEEIRECKIPVPSISVQNKFVEEYTQLQLPMIKLKQRLSNIELINKIIKGGLDNNYGF